MFRKVCYLIAFLLLAGVCFGQPGAYIPTEEDAPKERGRFVYDLSLTYRPTHVSTAFNTFGFAGVKYDRVSMGVGYINQNIKSLTGPDILFRAVTPQVRVGFGSANFFYIGTATTANKVQDYTEYGYGLEMGLFLTRL